ncbi:MCE family protein [Nocardia sp. NBC_00565]|uniref:MCE family protein n=1 Tax=Nocardia sp. NBC_00565 TaxID=2975993 RepID=UPI002E819CF2|nr:MCE family protein [Nocardia sp. NBC_00565]WUC05666.1 MCE family protein [Nocardia sp. NBC_00565]
MRITAPMLKFTIFAVTMGIFLFAIVAVFGKLRFENRSEYSALFDNVSGLKAGQFVRIAGVEVGRVEHLSVTGNTRALVTFSLDRDVPMTQATRAEVRYENLVGDRYMELSQGPGSAQRLPDGATLDVDHTAPALDLDAVIGGFRPLFKALDPGQVNKLSAELIATLQGQGGTIAGIASHTAQLTATLADRDQLIGAVITNLNGVLGTVNDRNRQFDSLVDNLQLLISGISAQAQPVADALTRISSAAGNVASLLDVTHANIASDVTQLGRVSSNIDDDRDYVDGVLSRLPSDYQRLSRLGLYGDFFSFYLCDVTLKVNGPNGDPVYINVVGQRAGRCTPPK